MDMSTAKSAAKRELRAALQTRRAARPPAERATATSALLDELLRGLNERGMGSVAGYVPISTEPGVGDGPALPEALRAAGVRLLLPVTAAGRELEWVEYRSPGMLVEGRYGLREPTGPRLGGDALGGVDAVLVPALAVDRTGRRLGRGAGYYDRALGPGLPVRVAVVYDDEVLAAVPVEPHDVPMTAVLTPGGGWRDVPIR